MSKKPHEGVPFQSPMSENVTIEKEKSSSNKDKIITEDDSNEESVEHMPTVVGTSSS